MNLSANKLHLKSVGYEALIKRYQIDVISNWHRSFIASSNTRRIDTSAGVIEEVYPSVYWPGDTPGDHLEFALKYDGANLAILHELFKAITPDDLIEYISSRITGKYARRVWFLYEVLTEKKLPLDDLDQGNYIDLLDPDEYYTVKNKTRISRQRINNNLPGDDKFCPLIRRTELLRDFENMNLPRKCREVTSEYSPEILKRAMSYLYTKETKSSFEIEHVHPSSTRTERFIALLRQAESEDFCDKEHFIELQNFIVDDRFQQSDYRKSQNYIGETLSLEKEKIHYISPKPEDVHDLMAGLVNAHERMKKDNIHPVIHAAAISYGFVFFHPFEDGNGRIHRFIIHNILARHGFTPEGMIFPISAYMLKNRKDYDASLEEFSRKVMKHVEYSLEENGRMTVHNETASLYRYMDMTSQAEALFKFIKETIETEFAEELAFLSSYDEIKKKIRKIVDMPDRKTDLFIRFCLQNKGVLSDKKRSSHFDFLTDEEVEKLEKAVAETAEKRGMIK